MMVKKPGTPILTWKLSLLMGLITLTVLGGGLLARPWFQETPRKEVSPSRPTPQRMRTLPTPGKSETPLPVEDANGAPRMPHVDDLFTPPRKGILKR